MKYSYWQTGVPVEGVVSSVSGVASKLGAGIGSAATGFLMGISGYLGGAEVQSESALGMVSFIYAGLPSICFIIELIILQFYDLDIRMPQIEKEISGKEDVW